MTTKITFDKIEEGPLGYALYQARSSGGIYFELERVRRGYYIARVGVELDAAQRVKPVAQEEFTAQARAARWRCLHLGELHHDALLQAQLDVIGARETARQQQAQRWREEASDTIERWAREDADQRKA